MISRDHSIFNNETSENIDQRGCETVKSNLHDFHGHKCLGFTLIELLCVLLITSLLFTSVSVQWNATIRAHQIETAIPRIQAFDEMVRARAKLKQPFVIRYDIDSDEVFALSAGEKLSYTIQVPIHSITLTEGRINTGVVEIPYFPDGSSLSYIIAVGIEKPMKSIAILGGTGQRQILDDSMEEKILEVI